MRRSTRATTRPATRSTTSTSKCSTSNADAVASATLKWSKSTRQLGVGDAQRTSVAARMSIEAPVNHNRVEDIASS